MNVLNLLRHMMLYVLNTHLYIGVCAAAYCWSCYRLAGMQAPWPYLAFLFGATVVLYGMPFLWLRYGKGAAKDTNPKIRWQERHFGVFILIYALFFLALAWITYSYAWHYVKNLWPLILLAFSYVLPLIPYRGRQIFIRDFGLTKPFILSLVWVFVCSPAGFGFWESASAGYLLFQWGFMFILCFLFDIRDIIRDTGKGLRTIPVRMGFKSAKRLSVLITLLLTGSVFLLSRHLWPPLLLSCVLLLLSHAFVKEDSSWYFYTFVIDGMMIAEALLLFAFKI